MKDEDFYKAVTQVHTVVSDAYPHEAKAPEALPEFIGPYKVESLLSQGGMSYLYLALHPKTHQPVTVKVLAQKFLNHREMIDRFLQEAQIISMTSHPNIVKLYGYGEWEGGLYIAMEFVQGISLKHFILQNTLSLRRALEIVLQISQALTHLHAHGVVHRDLKPENILLTADGGVKVIDFGIAQMQAQQDEERLTVHSRMMGTPIYMAPEQRDSPLTVSYAADIYSLGILCYELAIGKLSHGVVQVSLLPRGLQKIVARALQPSPQERYPDMVDFMVEISRYLESAEFEKDTPESDYVRELPQELLQVQKVLLPEKAPEWNRVEVGVFNNLSTMTMAGVYYDFFSFQDQAYGILLAESSEKGFPGFVGTAVMRGMLRGLLDLGSVDAGVELVSRLNKVLVQDPLEQIFVLSYLVLLPSQNEFRYISCGYGPLWYAPAGAFPKQISADNIALGITEEVNFLQVRYNWNLGDTILMSTFRLAHDAPKEPSADPKDLGAAFAKHLYLSPQKQVEGIFRHMSSDNPAKLEKRPVTLISVRAT